MPDSDRDNTKKQRVKFVRQKSFDFSDQGPGPSDMAAQQIEKVEVKVSKKRLGSRKRKKKSYVVPKVLLDMADSEKSAFLRNCSSQRHIPEMVSFYVDYQEALYMLNCFDKEALISFIEYGALICDDARLQTIRRDFVALARRMEERQLLKSDKARLALKGISSFDSHAIKVGVTFSLTYGELLLADVIPRPVSKARISEDLFEYCNHKYINKNFYKRNLVKFIDSTLTRFFPSDYAIKLVIKYFGVLLRPLIQQLLVDGGHGLYGCVKRQACCQRGEMKKQTLTVVQKAKFASVIDGMDPGDVTSMLNVFNGESGEYLRIFLDYCYKDYMMQELLSIIVNLKRLDRNRFNKLIKIARPVKNELFPNKSEQFRQLVMSVGDNVKTHCSRRLKGAAFDQMDFSYSVRRQQVKRKVLAKYQKHYCHLGRYQVGYILTWMALTAGFEALCMYLETLAATSVVEVPSDLGEECSAFNFSVPIEERIKLFEGQTHEFEGDELQYTVSRRVLAGTFLIRLIINFIGTYGISYSLEKDIEREVDEHMRNEGWDVNALTYEEHNDQDNFAFNMEDQDISGSDTECSSDSDEADSYDEENDDVEGATKKLESTHL